MVSGGPVQKSYEEIKDLIDFLFSSGQISFATSVEETFRKTLVLAAASNFEDRVINALEAFIRDKSNSCEEIMYFTRRTGIERKYFTYFQWGKNNANSFFSLFGPDRLEHFKGKVKDDPELGEAVKVFLELGELRNNIAHNNFVEFSCDKTIDEVYQMYVKASRLVEFIESELTETVS